MAISRYSENYCYDVIYDYNSFRQMSQDEMTIIILFRLDTILDGKFKPNSFNASWFQGEGFYCFLLVFCHFCWLSVWYRIHISSKWSKWAINDIKFFLFYRVLKLLSYCSIYFADSKGASSFRDFLKQPKYCMASTIFCVFKKSGFADIFLALDVRIILLWLCVPVTQNILPHNLPYLCQ